MKETENRRTEVNKKEIRKFPSRNPNRWFCNLHCKSWGYTRGHQ